MAKIAINKKKKPKTKKHRCGLCGKTGNLIKTDCCRNWICDDALKYELLSNAHNSCYQNHTHYTLCAYHYREGHDGDWRDCEWCSDAFPTELYVWYGTNKYNFVKLPDPPSFEPTRCSICGAVINLGEDWYNYNGEEYWCEECSKTELDEETFHEIKKFRYLRYL